MATIAAHPPTTTSTRSLPDRRFDHRFFPGMTWLMLVTVFVGFAPSYYLAGASREPLPMVVHIHALVFSCWILLLITQTTLTASGRINVHRRLGIAGFILACLMLIVGVWVATELLASGYPKHDPTGFYIIPIANIVAFTVLILFAYRARFDSAAHKRLIIVASTALMTAPIARWHLEIVHFRPSAAERLSYIFLLLLTAYDFWATRRLHRATMWAGAFLIAVQQFAFQFGRTPAWHAFAEWVQSMAQR
jgi:FtsH-binding integral membrane protein